MKSIPIIRSLFVVIFLSTACADLDIENLNDPDTETVLSTPSDLIELVRGSVKPTYERVMQPAGGSLTAAMADAYASNWTNTLITIGNEPRLPWENSQSNQEVSFNIEDFYNTAYAQIHSLNNIIKTIEEGKATAIGEDQQRIEAFARFLLGINYGQLSLFFDQGFIVRPGDVFEKENFVAVGFAELTDYSVENFQEAIRIANSSENIFYPDWFTGIDMDKPYFLASCHAYAARFLIGRARNKEQNRANDWNQILAFAEQGIAQDFVIAAFAGGDLLPFYQAVSYLSFLGRVDLRIINRMAPEYPARFPTDGSAIFLPPVAPEQVIDQRLLTDFSYQPFIPFAPNDGLYHFSNYAYERLNPLPIILQGDAPDFRAAEVDLIKAEALAELGRLGEAIDIINAGTRITRGEMTPLPASASKETILEAIFHERAIELYATGAFLPWTDMRRRDMLQKGSLLHFPLAWKELSVLNMDIYTFGGEGNADGVNTSNGGWF